MWTPTHVQVTVHKARNLVPKGKNGTNDAYVTIQLGKEKYQTTVKEKEDIPEWHEECDLPIPDMKSSIVINCYHRNLLGLDEFLGHINIPLPSFQIYERPKSRWYALKNKPNSGKKEKYRGELEVRVLFTVKTVVDAERERLQSKLDKNRSKQQATGDDPESTLQKLKHDTLKVTKSSPAKLEKRRQSRSHEVLPTTPAFSQLSTLDPSDDLHTDNRSLDSRDTCSTDNSPPNTTTASSDRKQAPPPKPPRTFLKEKSQEPSERLTQSSTDLNGSMSVSKLQRSPKQFRCQDSLKPQKLPETDIKSPAESTTNPREETDSNLQTTQSSLGNSDQSLTGKSDSLNRSLEDEEYFSRSNSFRQVIQRGSMRRSGGSLKDRQKSEVNSSPLLTATRRLYTDSNSSLDKVPEKLEAQAPTPTSRSTKSTGKDSELNVSGNQDKLEDRLPGNTPRKRDKKQKLDISKRHTICFDSTESSSGHNLNETSGEIKTRSETQVSSTLPKEVEEEFQDKDRDALIQMVLDSRTQLQEKDKYVGDLEEYIDGLLVKVIDIQPRILQNPFPCPLVQHHRPRQYNSTSTLPTSHHHSGLVLGVGGTTTRYTPASTPQVTYSSTLPSYGNMVAKNNNRNSVQSPEQQYSNNNTNNTTGNTGNNNRVRRMSPPKVIRAGQTNHLKKEKKSTNPFKRITNALKN